VVDQLVQELENALDIQKERKARGMQLIFAKFDSMRSMWSAAALATAMLDALGSLAQLASKPGYTRPKILQYTPDTPPQIKVKQGRHPCIEKTVNSNEFVPNNLSLGCDSEPGSSDAARVLLLSGPNMGGVSCAIYRFSSLCLLTCYSHPIRSPRRVYLPLHRMKLQKSTLLRQTCLIAILAQIGSFVPAAECELTPMDRIYTRLGACDRILLGQSTFFVEVSVTLCQWLISSVAPWCMFWIYSSNTCLSLPRLQLLYMGQLIVAW
jgi:DNA mismatch repair protein MSH6